MKEEHSRFFYIFGEPLIGYNYYKLGTPYFFAKKTGKIWKHCDQGFIFLKMESRLVNQTEKFRNVQGSEELS